MEKPRYKMQSDPETGDVVHAVEGTPLGVSLYDPRQVDKRLPPLDLPDYDGMIAALERTVASQQAEIDQLRHDLAAIALKAQ